MKEATGKRSTRRISMTICAKSPGEEITAKDFRTWAATNLAALALQEFELFDTEAKKKRAVVRAVENIAKHLGNTPAICRRCTLRFSRVTWTEPC